VRGTGKGMLRTFFEPKSVSNKCGTACRCTLKVCSLLRHAYGESLEQSAQLKLGYISVT